MHAAWWLLALATSLQDETEQKRTERFLARVSEAWRRTSPHEEHLGIFVGRKWIGGAVLKTRPQGKELQIEVIFNHVLAGAKHDVNLRLDSTDTLKPVRGTIDYLFDLPGGSSRTRVALSQKDGVLRGDVDEDGEKRTWQQNLESAAIPEPLFFFMARHLDPKDKERMRLLQLGIEAYPTTISHAGEQKLRVGGREVDASLLSIELPEGRHVAYFDRSSEEFLELRRIKEQGVVRFRLIKPEEAGKNLDEPLDLSDPEKVYVDFGWAVQNRDADALKRLIDFERMTQETLSQFGPVTKKDVEDLRDSVVQGLTGKEMPSVPGFSVLLEAACSDMFDTRIQDREAVVRFKYKRSFTLHMHRVGQGKDASWLIYRIK